VLTGDIPTAVATAGRIAAGIPIALAAMPALAILKLALGRKARTPELALRLRAWSAVLHVVAGVLILVTAIVEIWLRLAVGGPYLFAVYGAAGAIAILAVLALYLSFVAEKPPAPPKPPKPPKPAKAPKAEKVKAPKEPRGKKRDTAAAEATTESAEDEPTPSAASDEDSPADAAETTESAEDEATPTAESDEESQPAPGSLRNKRPAGKSRLGFRR
jgi:4-amino-4-deoxy-L-arabinose transferase-like glycosyltransferase